MKQIKFAMLLVLQLLAILFFPKANLRADSINSPNITLNVDTNRSAGAGAGNVSLVINQITIAETTLPEYSTGAGKAITIKVRPGFQFDTTSNVTIQSATIGFNGAAANATALLTPNGTASEVLTFNLTSGTSATVQDIIRINGIKLKILDAAGAAGPAQTTMAMTTSAAGGAFTEQGIVAATISKGAADHMVFSREPGNTQAGADLLPEVKIVDFGGNIVTNDVRNISLSILTNPGSATLLGLAQLPTVNGAASWADANDLNITTAADGYVLQAAHNGANFLTSNTINSGLFNITAGSPGSIDVTLQPANTTAGGDILVSARLLDQFSNPTLTSGVPVTVDSAINPGGWPLLTDSSLTKDTVNGVVTWDATDNLRILKATTGYRLSLSGVGAPVATSAFDVTSGAASLVRFSQQPSNVLLLTAISPPVSVELKDSFGNLVLQPTSVALTLSPNCKGAVTGGNAISVDGIATFPELEGVPACSQAALFATVSGLAPTASDSFRISAKDEKTVGVKATELKKGKFFKFNSTGKFAVSKLNIDNPTLNGATLTVQGSTGLVKYNLGKAGWRKDGNNGFKFQGKNCQSVIASKNALSANCQGKTGSIKLPETDLSIVLALGKGTKKFCGLCGGTAAGNPANVFNRKNCAKPTVCP